MLNLFRRNSVITSWVVSGTASVFLYFLMPAEAIAVVSDTPIFKAMGTGAEIGANLFMSLACGVGSGIATYLSLNKCSLKDDNIAVQPAPSPVEDESTDDEEYSEAEPVYNYDNLFANPPVIAAETPIELRVIEVDRGVRLER